MVRSWTSGMPQIERDMLERLPETRDPVTASLSTLARDQTLDRLERERFDCLVIGGGISGAGVAREAAISGLSVALLEAEDYAKLPPEPYLRGWVVEYARALGIVEAEALASSYVDRYRSAREREALR